ncbi:MAG: acyl-CoA dehydrogenase family protein [Myxococcota bacterium]
MTEEQEMVREAMREFAERAMRPIARECDESARAPDRFLEQCWELGLSSTQIPAEFGGAGEERSPVTNAILLEELAFGDASLALAALAPSLLVNALLDLGSQEQKRRLLPLFCRDEIHFGSLAVIEPGPLFDVTRLNTKAEPKGDGFVLSGRKCFVPMGAQASHFVVLARNNGGTDAFIVPADAKGVSVSEPEKKLGLKAFATTGLELERVEVPAADRLGGESGCEVQRLVDHARVGLAAVMLGVSRAALEYCVPYAKDREAFDEPIARKQAIAFCLAEMHMEVESMRWLVWKAASQLERGRDATRAARMAHTYAAEKGMWVADNGVQVLGGHGFIREHPVEMWFRNARTLGVLEGTVCL